MKKIQMCTDLILPAWMRREARQLAIAENRENGSRGAIPIGKKWAVGRVLRVRFLDGPASVRTKVEEKALEWNEHANITLTFGSDPNAEIRISFVADDGSWSFLGTDNLSISKSRPTMNFGWLTPSSTDTEFSRVVKHEFGHALGLIHEHQHPTANIPWDKPKVYEYYAQQGWSAAEVDSNLFAKYSTGSTQFSDYDKASIMHYPIDNKLTIGDYSVGWNTKLSDTDKSFIKTVYPRDTPDAKDLVVGAAPISASISAHGEQDLYVFRAAKKGVYTIETSGSTDMFLSLFNSDGFLITEDDDSGAGLNPRVTATLQAGFYVVRARHYQPKATGQYKISVKLAA